MTKRLIATALIFGVLGIGLATALTARAGDPDKPKFAVRDPEGTVVNVIVWDGDAPYSPGNGRSVVPFDPATHKFEASPTPTPVPMPTPLVPLPTPTADERLTAVETDLAAIKAQLGLK